MKVRHLEAAREFLDEVGGPGVSPEREYALLIDYAYDHRVGCDPDEFVVAYRRWWRVQSSTSKW